MKTKLELAHEYAIELIRKNDYKQYNMESAVQHGWEYADAMQAEADKRKPKEPRETHKNLAEFKMYPEYDASINYPPDAWVMYKGEKRLAVSIDIKKEWQPDWSQAPEWANWWAIGSLTKQGIWSEAKPNSVKINGADCWEVTSPIGDEHLSVTPSFNYTGDWRDSLRKRPN